MGRARLISLNGLPDIALGINSQLPVCIVVAHNDPVFLTRTVIALRGAGYEVVPAAGSMEALAALDGQRITVLITRVGFPEGTPHGVSLAMMARHKYPDLKTIFIADRSYLHQTAGIGELVPTPMEIADVLSAVERVLRRSPDGEDRG